MIQGLRFKLKNSLRNCRSATMQSILDEYVYAFLWIIISHVGIFIGRVIDFYAIE